MFESLNKVRAMQRKAALGARANCVAAGARQSSICVTALLLDGATQWKGGNVNLPAGRLLGGCMGFKCQCVHGTPAIFFADLLNPT